jgi:F-type H+-transporting ATPase subunit b
VNPQPSKQPLTRARLVLAAFVVAIATLTTALALAQSHETTPATGGHAATGAPAAPAHGAAAAPHGEGVPAHGEAGADAHAGAHHGPEAINWTDIFDSKRPAIIALVINFGVLMTLYYVLGKKPIAAALKQRRVTIGKDIDEAQKLLEEAQERGKKYQGDLKNAEVDAATAKASLITAAKGELDKMISEAQERADRMKNDADRLVVQERKQVHQDLVKETVDLAVREAAQLLEKSVTAEDHARLAQDLLTELSRRPAARSARSGGAA